MSHHNQRKRTKSMDMIRKTLAKAMPKGARERKFQALLKRRFGFADRTLSEYLEIMLECDEISYDPKTGRSLTQ